MTPPTPNEERICSYYQAISAKGKVAISKKKERGETMHLAPLGYKNARDAAGRSVLVPDPAIYPFICKARQMREEGISIRKIRAELERCGVRSKRGNRLTPMAVWRLTTLRRTSAMGYKKRAPTS
jgi:hypothetical protein